MNRKKGKNPLAKSKLARGAQEDIAKWHTTAKHKEIWGHISIVTVSGEAMVGPRGGRLCSSARTVRAR